jgi:hypothetical protein
MRAISLSLVLAALPSALQAEVLSSADREALLQNLEKLRDNVDQKAESRFGSASTAFRTAMASDDAALELYLKCVEKVDFTDRDRKPADFRDWRRREGDRISDPGFKRALRHQLRWLVLTLQAGTSKADRSALAPEAQQIIDAIFSQASELSGQQQVLNESVASSMFARAYDLNNLRVENWPMSPLQLSEVYESILLPPHRKPDKIATLKATWQKRISHETLVREHFSGGGRRDRNAAPSPESLRFANETLPSLQWQMEVDLFRSGDERAAAMRMLEHIEKHISHPRARDWGQQFKNLLSPPPVPAAATAEKVS